MGSVELGLLLLVGFMGGFLNTVAGGASLMTVPLLIYLGLPPTHASATNNLATTCQSLLAAIRHAQRGYGDRALVLRLGVPAVIGGAVGALVVVSMSDDAFRQVIAAVMVLALFVVARPRSTGEVPRVPRGPLLLLAGGGGVGVLAIYGGFFGGGVGLLLLPLIVAVSGRDLLVANGVKTALVFAMNVTATAVFLWHDMIHWVPASVLTGAMLVGAWVGVDVAIERGETWIRRVLVVVTCLAAAWLVLAP